MLGVSSASHILCQPDTNFQLARKAEELSFFGLSAEVSDLGPASDLIFLFF